MSDQPIYETDEIVIRREIHPDGSDQIHVEWSDDLAMVTGLGMLEIAKSTMLDTRMGTVDLDE